MAEKKTNLKTLGGVSIIATITLARERLRLFIATRLIKLAGWILGCQIEVEPNPNGGGSIESQDAPTT